MRLQHLVTYEDGTSVKVMTGPADVVAWEHEHGGGIQNHIAAGYSDWMWWLLWHSLVRRGGVSSSFADWLDTVAETGPVREATGDADALPPAETPGPSPDS